jgi:hypothetical protein
LLDVADECGAEEAGEAPPAVVPETTVLGAPDVAVLVTLETEPGLVAEPEAALLDVLEEQPVAATATRTPPARRVMRCRPFMSG